MGAEGRYSIKVGSLVKCNPISFCSGTEMQRAPERIGKVDYIHPERRYVRVGFWTPGGYIFESFHMMDVRL